MECTISVIDMNPQPPSPIHRGRRRRGCLCGVLVTLFGLSLLAFSAGMLALWPSHPIVTLSDATIKDFYISQSAHHLSAEFYLAFSVRNPNKNIHIDHKNVHAAVKYLSGPPLDEVSLPSFHMPGNSTTELQAKLATKAAFLDSSVSRWINYDVKGSVTTTFDVDLSTQISYKPWRSLWGLGGTTHILCKDVTVWFPFPDETHNAGSMVGPQRKCKVTRSWW